MEKYQWYRTGYKKSTYRWMAVAITMLVVMFLASIALSVSDIKASYRDCIVAGLWGCSFSSASVALTLRYVDEHEKKLNEGK